MMETGVELFGTLAADALMEHLDRQNFRTSNKHILDHLPAVERRALFDALRALCNDTLEISPRDGERVGLRAIRRDGYSLIPCLVVRDVEGVEGGSTEGFASMLRDHYSQGTEEARILLTLTDGGNETQKSAADRLVDDGLLSLPILIDRIFQSHGVGPEDERREIARVYLAYHNPLWSWTEIIGRFAQFLDATADVPPESLGAHLPLLGCFLSDQSDTPVRGPALKWDRSREGGGSRVETNARLFAKIQEFTQDPLKDEEHELRGFFQNESAERLISAMGEGFRSIDVSDLEIQSSDRGKNAFDYEAISFEGIRMRHNVAGQGLDRTIVIAASGAVTITLPLQKEAARGKEYFHLLTWNTQGGHQAAVSGAPELEPGMRSLTASLQTKTDFAVYRILLTTGPRSFKTPIDGFHLVVYRSNQGVVAVERSRQPSLEQQAWIRVGNPARFRLVSAEGDDIEDVELDSLELPSLSLGGGQQDLYEDEAEDDEFGLKRFSLLNGALKGRIDFQQEETIESEVDIETLEQLLYGPKTRDDMPAVVLKILRDSESYLSSVTDASRDRGDVWQVELGRALRLKVKSWNENGEEEALYRMLTAPDLLCVVRQGEGERSWSERGLPPSIVDDFPDFVAARRTCFELLAQIAKRHKEGGTGDGERNFMTLQLSDLIPHGAVIEAYAAEWVAMMEGQLKTRGPLGALHQLLAKLDILEVRDTDGPLRRLVVLPTHPWLLLAMLRYQRIVNADIRKATKPDELALTLEEVEALVPREVVEDWFIRTPSVQRLRVRDGAPFHWEFGAVGHHATLGTLDYVRRVVRNKIKRYLEMHQHLKDHRRTLRIGFVNPVDGRHLLEGIAEWIAQTQPHFRERTNESIEEWLNTTPKLEVLLFSNDASSDIELGAAFDAYFRKGMSATQEAEVTRALLSRLRYRKRRASWPEGEDDYVHLCFVHGLIAQDQYDGQDGELHSGWDGCFADGLLGTSLRRTREQLHGDGLSSERGLWIAEGPDPLRRGLAGILQIQRGVKLDSISPNYGIFWRVGLPKIATLNTLYANSDWVIHLDRELSLDLFRKQMNDDAPTIIEYSDQEDPESPGFDVITVTRTAKPYEEQLTTILRTVDMDVKNLPDQARRATKKLLEAINALSGTWALDFLIGGIKDGIDNRLKGNVGAALVYRWLRRVEAPALQARYRGQVIPLYVSLEELIRATPAGGLSTRAGLARRRRRGRRQKGGENRYCDDILVFYLTPARVGETYRLFGRVIEVKFGSSIHTGEPPNKAVAQVRSSQEILSDMMGGGSERVDAPFRHRQLSLLLKSQLEQAMAVGAVDEETYQNLNVPQLSAHLASGDYSVDYFMGHEGQNIRGDAFLLATTGLTLPTGQPKVETREGVRLISLDRRMIEWLAFEAQDSPTLSRPYVPTLPHIGKYGEGLDALLGISGKDAPGGKAEASEPPPPRGVMGLPLNASTDVSQGSREEGGRPSRRVVNLFAEARHEANASAITATSDPASADPQELLSGGGGAGVEAGAASGAASSGASSDGISGGAAAAGGLSLSEAVQVPVREREGESEGLHEVIERLSRALDGHRVEVDSPPSSAEADIGPRLVRAYVRLAPGEKISTLRKHSEDIARMVGTSTSDIHISNVPERHAVALDLPVAGLGYTVDFGLLRDHPSFAAAQREMILGFCAGIDVTGRPLWVDLAGMPHMLVAGTTGSGKTVFLRSVLLTLVEGCDPSELDLRLSSSKPMDFRAFAKTPHARGRAMATNPQEAKALVDALVLEMNRRIEIISEELLDNLEEYNADPEIDAPMPWIVAVLDEYAETVLSFSDKQERKDFEAGVSRLAQKARAAGIHLVLCMQRPDAQVIQGGIKSNVLHRFALKLPQLHDSRVILDEPGAETLLGQGDLLYKDASSRTHRLQVPFLDGQEVRRVIKGLLKAGAPPTSRPRSPQDAPSGAGVNSEVPDEPDPGAQDIDVPETGVTWSQSEMGEGASSDASALEPQVRERPRIGTMDIPQANDPSRILELARLMHFAKGEPLPEAYTHARDRGYYSRALIILGALEEGRIPTARLESLATAPPRAERAIFADAFAHSRVGRGWMEWGQVSSLYDLDPNTAEAYLVECSDLAASTCKRRSMSLKRWVLWIREG